MLNEKRIRIMTKLAVYEEKEGASDARIDGYFENDYIFSHMIGSFVSGTIAFVIMAAVYCAYNADTVIYRFIENQFSGMMGRFLVFYIPFIAVYLVITFAVYRYRFAAMRRRVRRYRRDLEHLAAGYRRERSGKEDL